MKLSLLSLWRAKMRLQLDRQRPYEARLRRDREYAAHDAPLPVSDKDLAHWVLGWADAQQDPLPNAGQVERVLAMLPRIALVLGLFLGASTATAALAYRGEYPVNLLILLGLTLLVPTLLLLVSLFVVATGDGGGAMSLSPARWLSQWAQRYLQAAEFDWLHTTLRRYAGWHSFYLAQWLGVGFFASVLACLLLFVALSDMAFGWSTTLSLSSESVTSLTSTASLPWREFWPAAVPSGELVELSRYVRLESSSLDRATAQRLGDWWPFIAMLLLFYGLAPRLLLLLFARWRARDALVLCLVQDGEVQALFNRARTVGLQRERELEDHSAEALADDEQQTAQPSGSSDAVVVIWNTVCSEETLPIDLLAYYGITPLQIHSLDIRQSLDERRAALQALASQHPTRLLVLTKGWEPPVLELKDVLLELAESAPAVTSIGVLPLATQLNRVDEADQSTWARALKTLAPRGVYVLDPVTAP